MILASLILSGVAIIASGVSMWLARISRKITQGRQLNRPERWVVGHLTRLRCLPIKPHPARVRFARRDKPERKEHPCTALAHSPSSQPWRPSAHSR